MTHLTHHELEAALTPDGIKTLPAVFTASLYPDGNHAIIARLAQFDFTVTTNATSTEIKAEGRRISGPNY